jgi:hypothetical protein
MTEMQTSMVAAPIVDLAVLAGFVRQGSPRVIEVGSWIGHSALYMAMANPTAQIHCIDTWAGSATDCTGQAAQEFGQERLLALFCKNVGSLLFDQIYPHVGTSAFWASVWPWQADVVYIDADHSYESVLADINAWTPHVRRGGILCGHDFFEGFPGVEKAVRETGEFERAGERVWWRRIGYRRASECSRCCTKIEPGKNGCPGRALTGARL